MSAKSGHIIKDDTLQTNVLIFEPTYYIRSSLLFVQMREHRRMRQYLSYEYNCKFKLLKKLSSYHHLQISYLFNFFFQQQIMKTQMKTEKNEKNI